MIICRFVSGDRSERIGVLEPDGSVRPLEGIASLEQGLRAALAGVAEPALGPPLTEAELCAPIDSHEIWGAGVTYERSKGARMEEAAPYGGADIYDRVYSAPRPELFFKATPSRVAAPGAEVAIRGDAGWSVPEPELAVWLDSSLRPLGFGLGNDMSARDIEAENPLYLPQAKIFRDCCSLGPGVLAGEDFESLREATISMTIRRGGEPLFGGELTLTALHRRLEELISYLGCDNVFPDGAVLLTGTGIVPPDELALEHGDEVEISCAPIGTLRNRVRREAGQ